MEDLARALACPEKSIVWVCVCPEMVTGSGGSRGNPAMAPHRSWQWSLAPLGGRKNNDSIVNLVKCKHFGPPPVSMLATDLAPLKKNATLKH